MDRTGCLTDEEIALFAGGAADAENRLRAERHMGRCRACRARWAEAGDPDGALSGHALDADVLARAASAEARKERGDRRSGVLRRALWSAAALAAVFLVAWGLGLFAFRGGGPEGRSPEGRAISGRGELVETAASADVVRLPDGSRMRIEPKSRVAFLEAGSGERLVVRLERGGIEAEIARAPGAVRILSESGEIRVVGTVFTAKAFRIYHLSLNPDPFFSVLSVEVSQGAVDLAGGAGSLRIAAGCRGIVRSGPGEAPVVQEAAPFAREEAARRWGSGWEAPGFLDSWNAATLLAGTWAGGGDWGTLLADRRVAPDLRCIAATLAGACAGDAEAGMMRSLFEGEPDEDVRRALLPHVARLLEEEMEGWLDEVARRDPSPRVRAAALARRQAAGDGE